jgi:Domain of unknown function (DUF4260)
MQVRTLAGLDPLGASEGREPTGGAVSGAVRLWLRLEGIAALVAGGAVYLELGGQVLWLIPLLLLVDLSMIGYAAGPRPGAVTYNIAHNWAAGILVLGAGWALSYTPFLLGGAILIAHVGMDRSLGYGLKYPTAFKDTHLGRLGR